MFIAKSTGSIFTQAVIAALAFFMVPEKPRAEASHHQAVGLQREL